MTAVGPVNELPARVHQDLGALARPLEARRQSGERLTFRQSSPPRVPGEGDDRAGHLVDEVDVAPGGLEGEVARPGAGSNLGERRIVRLQRAVLRVEAIDEDLVETEIGHEGEAIGRVDPDAVRVGLCLALGIDAAALMLDRGGALAEAPIRVEPDDRDAAALVVGDQDIAVRRIERDVARVGAPARLLVDQREAARLRIDAERADRLAREATREVVGVAGVEVPAVGMDHEEGGCRRFHDELGLGEHAGIGVEMRDGEAAPRPDRVRAEENEVVGAVAVRRCQCGKCHHAAEQPPPYPWSHRPSSIPPRGRYAPAIEGSNFTAHPHGVAGRVRSELERSGGRSLGEGARVGWWPGTELNRRHAGFQSCPLMVTKVHHWQLSTTIQAPMDSDRDASSR